MKNISATQPVVLVAQNSGGGQHQGRPCPQAFILQEALAAPKNVCFRGVDKGFPFFKNPRSAQLFFLGGGTSSQNLSGFSCPGAFRKCPSLLGKGGMVPQILRCARSTAHIPTCVPFAWSGTWSGSKKSLKSQTRSSRFCQGAERLESEDTKSRIPQH